MRRSRVEVMTVLPYTLRRGRTKSTLRMFYSTTHNNNTENEGISINTRGDALRLEVAYRD